MNPCHFRKSSGKPFCVITNRQLALSAKRTRTKETYCGWRKGTSWYEATSSSKEIKLVVLSIVELCLAEGIIG